MNVCWGLNIDKAVQNKWFTREKNLQMKDFLDRTVSLLVVMAKPYKSDYTSLTGIKMIKPDSMRNHDI